LRGQLVHFILIFQAAVVVVVLNLSSIPVKGSFFHAMSTVGLHFEGGAKFGKESA
jgi:hypothetical protein